MSNIPIIDAETDALYAHCHGVSPIDQSALAACPGASPAAVADGFADARAELETDLWRVIMETVS